MGVVGTNRRDGESRVRWSMGRFGTDVVALACIAGGALVGSGVTAGLLARGQQPHHRAVMTCATSTTSHVVIRLGEGDTSRDNVEVIAAKPCGEHVQIDLDEVRERVEVARVRMERARRSAEVARVQADEVRARAQQLRVSVEEIRIPSDEARAAADAARRAATNARFEAMERQLEAAAERLREVGVDDVALKEALDRLRAEQERVARITVPGSGGND